MTAQEICKKLEQWSNKDEREERYKIKYEDNCFYVYINEIGFVIAKLVGGVVIFTPYSNLPKNLIDVIIKFYKEDNL